MEKLRIDFQEISVYNSVQETRAMHEVAQVPLLGNSKRTLTAEASWSAGNKTYSYLKLTQHGTELFSFWGTNSWCQKPKAWQRETPSGMPEFLTYQPNAYPQDTPYGTIQSGYQVWRSAGGAYQSSGINRFPLSEWIRNPFPFQD